MKETNEDFIYRTVIVNPRQTKELSSKAREVANFQTYFFNKGVEAGLVEKYDRIKIGYTVADAHRTMPWSTKYHTNVATTAFQQGYDTANKHLKSCKKKRKIRNWAKKTSDRNHNWHKAFKNLKPDGWTDRKSLFRNAKNAKHASVTVNGQNPSLRMGKWKKLYVNLPGIGQVELLSSLKNLPKQLICEKDKNNTNKFYQTNIVSYRLVENTRKITVHTNDSNRTFEIHLTLRVPRPKNTDRTTVCGIDRGVKRSLVVHDGTDADFYRTPDACKRKKDDAISQQHSKRDGHKHNSNRWKKEDRKLKRMNKSLHNRRTEHDNFLAKQVVTRSGVIVMERLDIGNMTFKNDRWNSGLNREIYGAGMGKMGERIKMTAENHGTKILEIVPHYTSITCSQCNFINKNSRVTRDMFQCTYCGILCDADGNAAKNIRHYGLPCIRRLPLIDKYGNYKCENMDNIILSNGNIASNGTISGGRDYRHKTGGSRHGLYRAASEKDGNNQAMKDSSDCQKKTSVQKCNIGI